MSEGHTQRLEAALAGRYKIERRLGEGGMATVYLAEDLKHKRNVALKILRPELAAVIGAERFLAEITTTANLQHPHILPLFDSGEAEGYLYYVMPYIDGETLADRLNREKQLGVEESVKLAIDVGEALDYAHRNDIIHRDIKPANILIQEGRPVVADFGIALAVSAAGGGRMTETGLSLGTPHYMSPEQASADRDLSARSDVYSLGCVLYEMIAGQPPHTGPSAQGILVRILTADPTPLTELRHTVPPHVAAAVMKAIEKLPADRFDTARAFVDALQDESFTYASKPRGAGAPVPATGPTTPVGGAVSATWISDKRTVGLVAVTLVAMALSLLSWFGPGTPPMYVQRYAVDIQELTAAGRHTVMISPDGSRLAFSQNEGGGRRALYWREIGEEHFQRLETDDAPIYPVFSPDGEWLAYMDNETGALNRVALSGGAPRPIVPNPSDGVITPQWSSEGTITYGAVDGIWSVPSTGGEPRLLLATQGSYAVHPRLLPGERALLFTDRREQSTYVLDLDSDSVHLISPQGIDARYLKTGHLLFADPSGGLWAQPFDLGSLETTGDAIPLLGGVGIATGNWARYSISDDGTLVYSVGGDVGRFGAPDERLFVYDFEGNGTMLSLEARDLAPVAWAPDGETVAFESTGTSASRQEGQIFTYNTVLGDVPRPITFDGENENPEWSPDGTRIVFDRTGEGTDGEDLFVKTFGDDSPPQLLVSLPDDQQAYDWPTENIILFENLVASAGRRSVDIWVYDLAADSAYPYLEVEANVGDPTLSPDGTLLAYTQSAQGGSAVYVRGFPDPRQPELVSRGSDVLGEPRWAPDGRTLYYWTGDFGERTLLAARLRRDPSFAVTATDTLLIGDFDVSAWDIHPDGDRFIIPVAEREAASTEEGEVTDPIRFVVAVNWFEELLAIVGEGN